MKVITESALIARISDLAQDRQAIQIDANEQLRAIDGMINDCRYWLAQLAESKPGRKPGQPSPDALRKRAARARKVVVPPQPATVEPSASLSGDGAGDPSN